MENEGKTIGQIDCAQVRKNVELLPPARVTVVTKRSSTWQVLFQVSKAKPA
jgi:hypothetical protein